MDNRLYISFFVNARKNTEKNPVYLRITISGIRETINTGVFVTSQNWDSAKACIKGNDPDTFANNKLLAAMQTKAGLVRLLVLKALRVLCVYK